MGLTADEGRAHERARAPLESRHLWQWTTLGPLLALLTVFVLTVFDPFEFESVTKRQSENVFYKIYAASYPDRMRDSISVVLLDDDTLHKRNEPWPPSHLVHGQVLSAILSYRPAAVLTDIFFVHARDEDHFDSTEYAIERYHEAKVPLFLVAAGKSTRARQPARAEVQRLASKGQVTLVSAEIEAEPGEAPLYPLHKDTSGYEPAALALYRATCNKVPGAHCFTPDAEQAEMEVVWGLKPARFNCTRAVNSPLQGVCEDLSSHAITRTLQLLWEAFIPSQWRPTDPMRIPYHATVSTEDLLDGSKRQLLEPVLMGKIVIYGARIALVKDFVFSPVHGSTDGVFVHAMALDNLLNFGSRYIRQGAGRRTFHKEWTEFQPAALMMFASLAVMWNRRRLLRTERTILDVHALREADERFLWLTRWLLIGAVSLAGFIEFFVLRISPFNWLGLLISVHIAHWVDKWFYKVVVREVKQGNQTNR